MGRLIAALLPTRLRPNIEVKEATLSARRKLNVAAVNGAIVIAGVVGALVGSWGVFWLLLVVLLLLGLHGGDIRPRGRSS